MSSDQKNPSPTGAQPDEAAASASGGGGGGGQQTPTQGGERPQGKSEASSYAGSYRPGDNTSSLEPVTRSSEPQANHDWTNERYSEQQPEEAPPAYYEVPGVVREEAGGQGGAKTEAVVTEDGRVNININDVSKRFSTVIAPAIKSQIDAASQNEKPLPEPYVPPSLGGAPGRVPPAPMNVVIHVVGSRGDVQPFVALGKVLKETYNHRVRLATHPTFKKFVEENGLEFFSITGDPAELMAFMVKNPGLMPGFDVMRSGDIGKRRKGIQDIIKGCWRSCIETGDGFGVEASDRTAEDWMSEQSMMAGGSAELAAKPFIADAIIANPPSFAHIHCAERLGIPLHMMFTMPWSPTQAFPHPLANIQSSNADVSVTNYMTYALVDMLTWQGLGDVINRFRGDVLGLEPIGLMWAPGMLAKLAIPWTYCWSPALIPKPRDWRNFISISGFYFLNLASNFTPEPDLQHFLDSGPPPVYIGFGSIVVDDPNALTECIFDAVKKTGQRALVSKGWGGFGGDELGIPEGVFMLGNVPHDWLFKHVSAVVHHGGAGTTAAGIACGRPTTIVPFFGDQPFWGAMVNKAGAGPPPIPNKELNADNLADAINYCLKPETVTRAKEMSQKISSETGCQTGAQKFHQMLDVDSLRCVLAPTRKAVWRIKRTQVCLSGFAATVLAHENELSFDELKLFRARDYETDQGPPDPITGGASALVSTMSTMMMGVADLPTETLKALKIHPEAQKNKNKGKAKTNEQTPTPSETPTPSGTGIETPASRDDKSSISTLNLSDSTSEKGSSTFSPQQASTNITSPDGSRPESQPAKSSFIQDALRQYQDFTKAKEQQNASQGATSSTRPDLETSRTPSFGMEAISGTGKSTGRMIGAGLRSPMDFTLALSKGFHNASRLYGEEPRQIGKVDNLGDGIKTAGKEFGLGVFKGITGLITEPMKGAQKGGGAGLVKGFGKGIAGVVLKPQAGAFAIPAYLFKGIYKEVSKPFGPNCDNYILTARTVQGYEDFVNASEEERQAVVSKWRSVKDDLKKKKKTPGEDQLAALQKLLHDHRDKVTGSKPRGDATRQATRNESLPVLLSRLQQMRRGQTPTTGNPNVPSPEATRAHSIATNSSSDQINSILPGDQISSTSALPSEHNQPPPVWDEMSPRERELAAAATRSAQPSEPAWDGMSQREQEQAAQASHNSEMEEAIRQSMSQSAAVPPPQPSQPRVQGQAENDDEMLERALQASIAELQKPGSSSGQSSGTTGGSGTEEREEEAFQRAVTASMNEAERNGASEEEQKMLEEVLRLSVADPAATSNTARWDQQGPSTRRKDKQHARKRGSDSEWDSSSEEGGGGGAGMLTPPAMGAAASASAGAEASGAVGGMPSTHDNSGKGTDDDEELKRAIAESQWSSNHPESGKGGSSGGGGDDEEAGLREAMQQSEMDAETRRKQEEEERIVMEYVKRTSLAEEEARRKQAMGGGAGAGGSGSAQ